MMGSKEQPAPTLDASALAARSFNSSGGDRQKRDRPWCDYCKKPGHYKETCWKLHGKPADWKPKPRFDRDGRAHVAANSESTSVPEPSPFNKEQMEMLQKLLSQVGSGSTTGVAFTANRGGMRPWIVDTGASDHMTGDAAILQNYKPSNGHSSVHIADGSKSKIAGTGSIKLTKDLYLDSVLHVPNLDCNLLSISKLAHDLQCVTKFYPNLCVFQDLKSGKMIGSAELCSGLYLLSCGQFSNQVSQASCVQSQSMSESFNSVSNSKGESMNEHQVWESFLEGVPSFHSESPNPSQFAPTELSTPMPPSVQPAQHTNVPSPVTIQSPMPIQPIAPQLANENLQVYIRRRKRQELEHGSQSTCGQYIDSNSSLPEENIGEDRAGEVLIPSIDDSTLPIALRKGVRRCTDHPIGNYVTYEGLSPSYRAFATSLDDTQVPNTIQEALKISEWKKAVQDEIDALEKNGTWTITDLPVGKRPVGCKWIFTIKYKADGSVERFKARLVARGFTQSYGIDYQETFAPVAKLNTIRILLSLAVNQDWCLQQLDIKNAFLNGDLEEEVYMEIPPGFEESMAKNQIKERIVVSQRKYILDLLKETGMLGCKPIDTPMDSQKKLAPLRNTWKQSTGFLEFKNDTRKGLFFRKTENRDTEVYSDADWAGNIIDRRSTSGYCSFVWGNLVTWRSKKQSVVARSSAEAEYRALAQGICSYKHSKEPRAFMTGPSMLRLTDTLSQRRSSEILHLYIPPSDALSHPLQVYHRRHHVVAPPLSLAKSTSETLSHPRWRQAMVDEMTALHSNDTGSCFFTPGKSTVGCRWVYTIEVDPDGQLLKLCVIGLFISLDIKNVFLHGELLEESPRHSLGVLVQLFKSSECFGVKQIIQFSIIITLRASASIWCGYVTKEVCLRHLGRNRTPGQGMLYEDRGHTQIVGYTDADWAGSPSDRRSTLRYCVFIGGNLISWKSKKQDVVARSSAEAEYRAMALATCELIWLRQLLQELRFGKDEQMKLVYDNQVALHIASNPVFHERTKHIEVDYHFIREKIASRCVARSFVNSNDQLADIFTKSLRGPRI
ncbi:Retrovirus-related Pol polyprotein from transposon TNT 1-94 [Vitis vinifera]|uniref:Retrovirus-related Pol polyprotein from transposon TNT 1-94 n=1 Tax=Vitis vinifera TaxID=29760 RepID=A0A438H5E4_VITVI|nr:Retrovirus-related Pol polyprotein from transposon TNT 1-94 [Vitis vinifera]